MIFYLAYRCILKLARQNLRLNNIFLMALIIFYNKKTGSFEKYSKLPVLNF